MVSILVISSIVVCIIVLLAHAYVSLFKSGPDLVRDIIHCNVCKQETIVVYSIEGEQLCEDCYKDFR